MKTDVDIWKPVQAYEGYYEISNSGIVRSLERTIAFSKGSRKLKSRTLQSRMNNCGYAEVRLSKNGIKKTTFVHIILAQAFIPNPDAKPEINHRNGIKVDNSLENLEWVTHSENMLHAYSLG